MLAHLNRPKAFAYTAVTFLHDQLSLEGMQWSRLGLIGTLPVLLLLSTVLDQLALWQHSWLSSGPYLPEGGHADSVVVLGYALKRDGTPTLPLRQRVDAGVRLFDEEQVQYIVFSGGHPGGGIRGRSEAAAMKKYAEAILKRKQPERLLLEEESTSTRENAIFSLRFAEEHRWTAVVIATSPFHQLRSRLVFECAVKQNFLAALKPKVTLGPVFRPADRPGCGQ